MKLKFPVVLAGLLLFAGCSGNRPELGMDNGKLLPCPETPNCVNSRAADEQHAILPIRFKGTAQQARALLLQVLESEPRVKFLTVQEDYIRAEFTSALFRFVDDVEFSIVREQGAETVIHVRSASRIGYSDLGVNRKRIERIRSKVQTTRSAD